MKLDNILNEIIGAAFSEAKYSKHEYFTPEHILYASLFFKESREIVEACGGDVELMRKDIKEFFKANIEIVEDAEPIQTVGIQNVVSSAGNHVYAAGKDVIKIGDIYIAMYDEEESFAGYYFKKQEISRIDILNFISHGISTNIDDELEDDSFYVELENEDIEEEEEEVVPNKNLIDNFTTELTEKAKKGEIDPLIGREKILERTIQVLCRRLKNNPIHVGEPGVGKTAITEGLAKLIAEEKVPKGLRGFKIYSLDMGSMLAGTKFRGDFEDRIKKVLNKLKNEEKAIVYIDEIHTIIGAGSTSGGSLDASNILKPFLTEGKLKFIGATTYDEYKKVFEKDKALSRRFQKIDVVEPTTEESYSILFGLKETYENFHRVKYSDEAIKAAVDLSQKYINDRFLPDKAIDVMDEAGANIRLNNDDDEILLIDEKQIEKIIASMAKIPEKSVSVNEIQALKTLDLEIKKEIYGQDPAIESIVKAIKRSRAGFNEENKTVANLLFVGPTGVGKTEISKQLSKALGIPLLRFDMSEYQEKHTVARLIGSPPGYVGYEEGGLLTDAVRKNPHCVLLLDEIEKVHGDVLNILLQMMDYATLTDNTGKKADFKNVILIMTSNAGAREIGKFLMGFGERILSSESINKEVERVFSPEFRNRLDEIVVFNKMDEGMALLVAKKAIRLFEQKLIGKNIKLSVTDELYKWLVEKGINSNYGAREINRTVEQEIKPYFVDEVLFGELTQGGEAIIDRVSGKVEIKIINPKA